MMLSNWTWPINALEELSPKSCQQLQFKTVCVYYSNQVLSMNSSDHRYSLHEHRCTHKCIFLRKATSINVRN